MGEVNIIFAQPYNATNYCNGVAGFKAPNGEDRSLCLAWQLQHCGERKIRVVNGAYPCEPCDSAPGDGLSGVAVVVDCDVFVAVVDDVALSGLDVGGGQSCQETQPENALGVSALSMVPTRAPSLSSTTVPRRSLRSRRRC